MSTDTIGRQESHFARVGCLAITAMPCDCVANVVISHVAASGVLSICFVIMKNLSFWDGEFTINYVLQYASKV
jgi:hypothetical protein